MSKGGEGGEGGREGVCELFICTSLLRLGREGGRGCGFQGSGRERGSTVLHSEH